jgi:hypothetical protein
MKHSAPLQRRMPLREKSNSETAAIIQRDGGCIFHHYPEAGACGWYRKDGELTLQADHLNTRARTSATATCGSPSAPANVITFSGNRSIRTNTCASREHIGGLNILRCSTEWLQTRRPIVFSSAIGKNWMRRFVQ